MKKLLVTTATAIALAAGSWPAAAQSVTPTVVPSNYSLTKCYTHVDDSDMEFEPWEINIGSYAWGADGKLYYGTYDTSEIMECWAGVGLYSSDLTTTENIRDLEWSTHFSNMFAMIFSFNTIGSVVVIGDNVYFGGGDWGGDEYISKYDTTVGDFVAQRDVTNYALAVNGGNLFITGSELPYVDTIIYYSVGGEAPSVQIGVVPNSSSGPLAFDKAGNLYTAPGMDDKSVYRWTSAEVVAAVGGGDQLVADEAHLLFDYSAYPELNAYTGGSSLLMGADGLLYLTLTNVGGTSTLIALDIDEDGNLLDWNTILTSDKRLGDLVMHDGNMFIAVGDSIFKINSVTVPMSKKYVPATDSTFNIEVDSNIADWYVNINPEAASWLSFEIVDGKVKVTVKANAGLDGRTGVITISGADEDGNVISTTFTVAQYGAVFVYETKISARTSVVRKMNVKIKKLGADGEPIDKKFDTAKDIYFRAPVTKSYTLFMAYDGTVSAAGNAQGVGFMLSTADKKNDSLWFDFTEESKRDARISIGNKGQNFPVSFEFNGDNSKRIALSPLYNEVSLRFKGLASVDKNGIMTGIAGQVEGWGFVPTHDPKDAARSKDQGGHGIPAKAIITDGSVHYPQTCYVPGTESSTKEIDEAHFYGTFTTRLNKAKSSTQAVAEAFVNSKVPASPTHP